MGFELVMKLLYGQLARACHSVMAGVHVPMNHAERGVCTSNVHESPSGSFCM